jgi:hypothetical protein
MCHFITAVIDKKTNLDSLNALGKEYIISFTRCSNQYVEEQLRDNEQYLAKHCKYCDCGTQLGMLTREQSPDLMMIEKRDIEKLQRKGWSENKIKRWIADREKSIEKDKARYEKLINGHHADVYNWLLYFNKVLSESQMTHIGLLLHWYKGATHSERIKIKDRRKILMTELTEEVLLKMEEDVIYDIVGAC